MKRILRGKKEDFGFRIRVSSTKRSGLAMSRLTQSRHGEASHATRELLRNRLWTLCGRLYTNTSASCEPGFEPGRRGVQIDQQFAIEADLDRVAARACHLNAR